MHPARAIMMALVCVAVATFAPAADAAPVVRVIEDFEGPDPLVPEGGEVVAIDGNHVLRWEATGRDPEFVHMDFGGLGVEADEWDRIEYRYRVDAEKLGWWGLKVTDFPLADGYQATYVLPQSEVVLGEWREVSWELHHPRWRWGDAPNREAQTLAFRASDVSEGAVFYLDDIRFVREALALDGTPAGPSRLDGDTWRRAFELSVISRAETPLTVRFEAVERIHGARIQLPDATTVPPRETVRTDAVLSADAPLEPLAVVRATVAAVTDDNDRAEEDVAMAIPLGQVEHPSLVLTAEDVPRINERIERYEWAEAAWQGLKRSADSWLEREIELPERGGQWYHWYTCDECGARLKTVSPTEHRCPECGKVFSGWPYDDVPLTGKHHGFAKACRDLGLVYVLTGERAYAEKAREILLGYADRYLDYPMHNVRGEEGRGACHVGPQPLTEAVWLIPIAQGFDCIFDTLSEEDRSRMADRLLLPAAELVRGYATHIHNIPCWENSAYGSVGITLGNEELAGGAINGEFGFRNQIAEGVTDDGMWYEGAWGYHYYTMNALQPLAVAAENVGIDVYSDRYLSMFTAPVRMMGPTGMLPAFNDSGRTSAMTRTTLYENAYTHWPEPELAMVINAGSRESQDALLYGADEVPAGGATELSSHIFGAAGIAVLRTDAPDAPDDVLPAAPANYLAFEYGPHGGGHGHPDKLGFVLWAQGRLVAPDAGSIAYGNPAHGAWYKRTLSHNTVVVDGVSQEPTEGWLLFSAFGEEMALAGAESDGAYDGVTLRRVMALLPESLLEITVATSDDDHQYDWAFHARGELSAAHEMTDLDAAPGEGMYEWAEQWRTAGEVDGWQAAWEVDDGPVVRVAQATSRPVELMAAVGRGNPPSARDPFVVARAGGNDAAWCTGLWWDDAEDGQVELVCGSVDGGELPPSEAVGVRLTRGTRTTMLLVAPEGGASFGDVTLSGAAALVELEAGRPVSWLIADGAELRVREQVLE